MKQFTDPYEWRRIAWEEKQRAEKWFESARKNLEKKNHAYARAGSAVQAFERGEKSEQPLKTIRVELFPEPVAEIKLQKKRRWFNFLTFVLP